MPAYGPLLDELGQDFGTSNDKMYYCGAYILTEYEPQVKRTYEKNYQNWDADNVYITKLAQTYNAESSTLAPAMVLRGEIDYADIPTSMLDEWLQSYPEYLSKDRAVPITPTSIASTSAPVPAAPTASPPGKPTAGSPPTGIWP